MLNIVNRLLKNSLFPIALKFISLAGLMGLIYIGFLGNHNDAGFLKQLRNFNLANLLVWSYW